MNLIVSTIQLFDLVIINFMFPFYSSVKSVIIPHRDDMKIKQIRLVSDF